MIYILYTIETNHPITLLFSATPALDICASELLVFHINPFLYSHPFFRLLTCCESLNLFFDLNKLQLIKIIITKRAKAFLKVNVKHRRLKTLIICLKVINGRYSCRPVGTTIQKSKTLKICVECFLCTHNICIKIKID